MRTHLKAASLALLVLSPLCAQDQAIFVLNYVLATDQNVVTLPSGGTIVFDQTTVGSTAQAAFNITNTGVGPGTVMTMSLSGEAFRLSGLPLFPRVVPARESLSVQVIYRPTGINVDLGTITVAFIGRPTVSINLRGTGSTGSLSYRVESDPMIPLPPGGTAPFPATRVGASAEQIIRISNTGNAAAAVNSILVSGEAFALGSVPVLPATIAPNSSTVFTIRFLPTRPGTNTGVLTINSDRVNLAGTGLAAELTYSYTSGGVTTELTPGNLAVVFAPTSISQSSEIGFVVRNTGTLATTITNIGIGQTNSPYAVSGIPPLPVRIEPGAELSLLLRFTPTALGFVNGTLILDSTVVSLSGSGTAPPPLPAYSFTGLSSVAAPLTQPRIGLTLASPYPVPITGTLTLDIAAALPPDPAVQFSSGGRTVAFTIPANTTEALFAGGSNRIGLQTGTVASSMTIAPTFATSAGDVDLTPGSPAALQFQVASAAPTLLTVQFTNVSGNTFTLEVTGFSTPRTLTRWNLQFTPVSGVNITNAQFSLDIRQIANAWFQRASSQSFGGQFTISLPLVFGGTDLGDDSPVSKLASLALTIENEVGTSNSLTANLR